MAEKQLSASENGQSDAEFLQAAYEEHAPWLKTVVRHRLGEPQAVDDVMQEVAVAVFRQTAPIRDPERVAPWLYRIAVRQTLMYRRTAGRRRKLEAGYADQMQADRCTHETPEPLRWLLSEEREQNIKQAIEGLSDLDREILMLKYTENWSYADLASHLGVTIHTIEYRLLRARKRLRKALASLDVVGART